jgi:hypothetical protein
MKLSADTAVRYHTKTGDKLSGPYTVEGLESLVYLQKITADTPIRREGADAFVVLRDSELATILFPRMPQKLPPQHWAPPGQENDPARLQRKHYQFTAAKFEKINAPTGAAPKVDVYEILDDIRQTEIASGLDEVRPSRFKISKRSRDFWFMLVVGNGIFIGAGLLMGNTASLVFALGGCGVFTLGLLWSMYGVMGRY